LYVGACVILLPGAAIAQTYSQRGFLEMRATGYAQKAPNDDARSVGESLFRYEGFLRPSTRFEAAGAIDFRADTHRQAGRGFDISWQDRELRRPLAAIRRLSATYHRGPITLEAGKQFVRWGKTDIVTPTDRFAPRDFLTVVDNELLAVTAGRVSFQRGTNTIEAVWSPRFTPSRVPLIDQRWAPPAPSTPFPVRLRNVNSAFPGGPQSGVRWNHTGFIEFEFSFYQGYNHLPSIDVGGPAIRDQTGAPRTAGPREAQARPGAALNRGLPLTDVLPVAVTPAPAELDLQLFYPKMTMAGADVVIPTSLFTVKGEAAHFSSSDTRADEYALYVVQLEKQTGEWFFVGGYAGESVTERGTRAATFAPDRGLTKTLLGRASYTIDANRSVALESAVRQNLDGLWAKGEYSQAFGQHWRATLNLTLIRGERSDFLGQYRRNSHALLILRYSF
jgi:hypothetical protein